MYKRAREEFDEYRQFLRRTRPRIDRSTVTVHHGPIGGSGIFKRRSAAIRPRAVLRTGGLLPNPTNVERKWKDTQVLDDATSTASITCLNLMTQGAGPSQRIGQRILVKSIQLRAHISREDVASTTTEVMRIMLYYDRQPNGALPAITDINVTNATASLRSMANTGRFFCLMDENVVISTANGGNSYEIFDKFIKCNLPVYYNAGNAGTIADLSTGSLLLIYVGDQAAGADDINVVANARLRYTDM